MIIPEEKVTLGVSVVDASKASFCDGEQLHVSSIQSGGKAYVTDVKWCSPEY